MNPRNRYALVILQLVRRTSFPIQNYRPPIPLPMINRHFPTDSTPTLARLLNTLRIQIILTTTLTQRDRTYNPPPRPRQPRPEVWRIKHLRDPRMLNTRPAILRPILQRRISKHLQPIGREPFDVVEIFATSAGVEFLAADLRVIVPIWRHDAAVLVIDGREEAEA